MEKESVIALSEAELDEVFGGYSGDGCDLRASDACAMCTND